MRMLTGVIVGLLIGAALAFSVVAVASIAASSAACGATAPAAWQLRADVSRSALIDQLPSQPIAIAGGYITLKDTRVTPCGGIVILGEWTNGTWRLPDLGLEATLIAEAGRLRVTPRALWFGRLSVPIGWMPTAWYGGALAEVNGELAATLDTGGSGLQLCGIGGADTALSLYLCDVGTAP